MRDSFPRVCQRNIWVSALMPRSLPGGAALFKGASVAGVLARGCWHGGVRSWLGREARKRGAQLAILCVSCIRFSSFLLEFGVRKSV